MKVYDLTKAFNKHFRLKKTATAIGSALKKHKIRCGREHRDRLIDWRRLNTPGQELFIAKNYPGKSILEMTKLFNLRFKTARTQGQIKSFVKNHGIVSGRTGCFEKGHESWNKGTKGLVAANKTSFKKGRVPANIKPIGHERICHKYGFILIKINEKNPYTVAKTRYKHKHVYIWEQENGPVPNSMVVAFKDSDKTNCEPDNLMLISRAELLRLNRFGYKNMPAELKPSVLGMVKLMVKTHKKERKLTEGVRNGKR